MILPLRVVSALRAGARASPTETTGRRIVHGITRTIAYIATWGEAPRAHIDLNGSLVTHRCAL
jgi:hypothetical protein